MLERILGAGLKAPSSNHQRRWELLTLTEKSLILELARCIRPYPCLIQEPKTPQQEMSQIAYPRQRSMVEEAACVILPFFKQKYPLSEDKNGYGLMDYGAAWALVENMLLAAFYGGVAITASSTVAVHALSYPLGGTYRIAHGVSNAMLLPYVMQYNMDAIYDSVPAIVSAMGIDVAGMTVEQQGQRLVEELFAMTREMNIPNDLKPFGVKESDLEFLTVAASEQHRLLDQNPKDMSLADIRSIYEQLL